MERRELFIGDKIDSIEKGFVVKCKVGFEDITDLRAYVEVGLFPEDKPEVLSQFLTRLSGLVGKSARVEAYVFFKEKFNKEWPVRSDGIPAYIETYMIVFHDGEGGQYVVGSREVQ